jgi:hypothetical protein
VRAASFVGEVGTAVDGATAVRRSRCRQDSLAVWTETLNTLDALSDLVVRLGVAVPLPVLDRSPRDRDEAAVETILTELSEQSALRPRDVGEELDTAIAADRAAVVDNHVVVPLSGGGRAAANWYTLFSWMAERLGSARELAHRAASRLKPFGMSNAATAWDGIAAIAADLRQLLGNVLAVTTWVNPPDAVDPEVRETQRMAAGLVRSVEDYT